MGKKIAKGKRGEQTQYLSRSKAIRKLQHPVRARKLQGFLEGEGESEE